jgi:hypothetical protein
MAVTACSGAASIEPPLVAAEPTAAMALPPLTEASDAAVQEATRLIVASQTAYARCATYEDEGTSEHWDRPYGRHTSTAFHTVFAGPRAVRFAYREANGKTTQLLSNETGAWCTFPWSHEPEQQESLEVGLGGLAGVSRRLSTVVLPLLLGLPPGALRVAESVNEAETPCS